MYAKLQPRSISTDFLRNLDGDRGGLAAANAQGCDAPLFAPAAQRVNQSRQDSRPARANRVAQRTGATVDIDALGCEPQFTNRDHRYHCEGLVDLEEIH